MNAPFAPTRDAPDGLIEVVRDAVRLPAGTRIVAAMSGGVDSTVTAALLARAATTWWA
jgi:tRNA-specific 2-thiouridylase